MKQNNEYGKKTQKTQGQWEDSSIASDTQTIQKHTK